MIDPGAVEHVVPPPPPTRNPLKRLYRWVLTWAHHPAGTWVLAILAFLDSSVFPIPPLFLQVALSIERPRRAWWYAAVNTIASVAGACLGYYIGYALWDAIGVKVVGELSPKTRKDIADNLFQVALIYSFIPLPYKLITIGSGFLHANLGTLLLASTIGRSLRFNILAWLCWKYGVRAGSIIEKYFNWVLLAIGLMVGTILLVTKVVLAR